MYLEDIVGAAKRRLHERKLNKPPILVEEQAVSLISCSGAPAQRFRNALKGDGIGLIAEYKKASPSKGLIREDLDPEFAVSQYERGGARAISVLTEEDYFLGSCSFLERAAAVTHLPILRKDFIIDRYQVFESRLLGASAVLLIVSILEQKHLTEFIELSKALGLDALVEVHNPEELGIALDSGADLIGVNNRCLKTFQIDLRVAVALSAMIPGQVCRVAESGISKREHVDLMADAGYDAVLVGDALMRAPSPRLMAETLFARRFSNGRS